MSVNLPYRDRTEAGRLLGAELAKRKHGAGAHPIVLALPRGGLPVAVEVAEALHAPLDLVVVRKLGVPWQPELAMGAMASGAQVLDHPLIRELRISREDVDAAVARETAEMERREKLYRGGRPAPDLRGCTVFIVDDGLATGSTMLAAVRCVRQLHPHKLIAAVPVGSVEACDLMRKETDECVCLAIPEPFCAVGEWYHDFQQVSDPEVQQIMQRALVS